MTIQQINTGHPDYPFVEKLLHTAFPEEERRADELQRRNTDSHPQFGCYLVAEQEKNTDVPIGLITLWHLNGFCYVEHLATIPSVRNSGYGQRILSKVGEMFPGLIVLEVEPPEDEMAIRRIGFYRRCGFSFCEKPYLQPPYRQGDKPFPLCLMFRGADSIDEDFTRIRDEIHRCVYGVNFP